MLVLGCGVARVCDARDRSAALRALRDPSCGFRLLPDGETQLWRFTLDEPGTEAAVAPPSGTALPLCAVFGLPFARLRAALPDEFFPAALAAAHTSRLGAALGRRHGLSPSHFEDGRTPSLRSSTRPGGAPSSFVGGPFDGDPPVALSEDTLARLSGSPVPSQQLPPPPRRGGGGPSLRIRPTAIGVADADGDGSAVDVAVEAAAAAEAEEEDASGSCRRAAPPSPLPFTPLPPSPVSGKLASAPPITAAPAAFLDDAASRTSEFVGTALVLSLFQVSQLMPQCVRHGMGRLACARVSHIPSSSYEQ